MSQGMFRKKALAKLASPEQLDELMRVTTPRGWLALIALCAIVITAVSWGIYGRIPTRVSGKGMLIRPAGVFNIPAKGQGPVTRVFFSEGDRVKAGQVVAEIAQIDLVAQVEEAKEERLLLQEEHKKVLDYAQKEYEAKMAYVADRRKILTSNLEEQESLVAEAEKLLAAVTKLEEQRIASELQVAQSKQTAVQIRQSCGNLRDQLNELSSEEAKARYELAQQRVECERAEDDVKRKIALLETRLKTNSQVISPYDGRVLEVMVDPGSMVNMGSSILSVELAGKTLQAVLFIPDTLGKKVVKGMSVEVTPTTVKREEYGYMIGTVETVSDFPATVEGMMRLLHNESLVKQLSNSGVPLQVNAALVLDPKTPSGYKWSSGTGPRLKISNGTICDGSIVVGDQAPITLVIPLLKKFFGLT